IVLRSERPVGEEQKKKIALFCNVDEDCVIQNLDLPLLYSVPLALKDEKLDDIVCRHFHLDTQKADLADWTNMVNTALSLT
ncbi:MAG TPA: CTP synthase, partial [Ruminococcaceae bacterium]|nr:CTP synthase [Oscillospiraceae bacterium]